MYADDSSITFAGSDVDEMNNGINIDLERIRVWLAGDKLTLANKLTLNKSSLILRLDKNLDCKINEVNRIVNCFAKQYA